jgi:hypothetical protein
VILSLSFIQIFSSIRVYKDIVMSPSIKNWLEKLTFISIVRAIKVTDI